MTSLNTICQNMKLKLVKMIKNFVKILELLGDRLEVCVSVHAKYYVKSGLTIVLKNANKTKNMHIFFHSDCQPSFRAALHVQ